MNMRCAQTESRSLAAGGRGAQRGVTLIEMLVAVSLLVMIMAGLFLSYYHVQRAYGIATSQQDVLETGRAAVSLVRRDLAEMSACGLPQGVNLYAEDAATNLGYVTQDAFWLNRVNDGYAGVGYFVEPRNAGVGTLFRFETNGLQADTPGFLPAFFNPGPRAHRVAEGVVALRLRAYDSANLPYDWTNSPAGYSVWPDLLAFTNKALPGFVEMELAVLDSQGMKLFNTFTNLSRDKALEFLSNNPSRVYFFRQRIPIQNRHDS